MRKLIIAVAMAVVLPTSVASAQVVVSPAPEHHSTHGYLYAGEARLRTVQVVKKFAQHHQGTYVIGKCTRRSRLAINCAVARKFTEQDTATVCDYVSRVRKQVRGRSSSWWVRLDLAGTGCRLA